MCLEDSSKKKKNEKRKNEVFSDGKAEINQEVSEF